MGNILTEQIAKKGYLVADGAMGTNLFVRGLQTGDAPELWNVEHPERIADVHRSFIAAGTELILTNSFGGSEYRLKLHNATARVEELNSAAAKIARQVADGLSNDIVVAGSIGPTGELFEPLGPISFEQGKAAFAAQAQALALGGVDLIWIETMSAKEEVAAAVAGADTTGLPITVTMTFDTNGRTMMGVTPQDAGAWLSELSPNVVAIGANCGVGPAEALVSLLAIAEHTTLAIVAKANCGVPEYVDGDFRFTGTPELMADYAKLSRNAGAVVIGGCCGSEPIHIAAMTKALANHTPGPKPGHTDIAKALGPLSNLSMEPTTLPTTGRRRSRRRRG